MSTATEDHIAGPDEDEFEFDEIDDPLASRHARPPSDSPLRPNVVLLRRFHLRKLFDKSGQSAVWAAWDAEIGRFVVLKFVHPRLLEEAQHAANVPGNVIAVYDHNNTAIPENPFLVLEFARGGPLDEFADVWMANPVLLIEKYIPVVRTLATAHNTRAIVHRDIKPSNLLLSAELPSTSHGEPLELPGRDRLEPREFTIKVTDWGLAAGDGDAEAGRGGTPGFAEPAQWRSPAAPTADVFGLVSTLYFLLTGKCVMPTTPEFVEQLRAGTAPYAPPQPVHELNPKVDRRLSRVIMTSLAVEPMERHASADALANELGQWLHGYAVTGDSGTRRMGLWSRRNWFWIATAGLVVALVAWTVVSALRIVQEQADAANARADAADKTVKQAEAEKKESQERIRRIEAEARVNEVERAKDEELRKADKTAAARTAARRGDWPTALKLFDEVIREGNAVTAQRLRVERLFGYFATNDQATLLRELKELERAQDLGALAARVKLVRGAYMMCDPSQADDGRELIRQALGEREASAACLRLAVLPPGNVLQEVIAEGARDTSFSPADVLYAEALLETRPRPLLDKLNAAVKLDVLHYPAHSALVVALITSGNPDAANRQAEVLAGLFPDSPVPAFVRAQTSAIMGNQPNMQKALVEFGLKARADTKSLVEYFQLYARVLDLRARLEAAQGKLKQDEQDELDIKTVQMHWRWVTAFRPLAFSVPIAGLSREWHFALDGQFQQMVRAPRPKRLADLPKWDAAGHRLEEFAKDYPEALAQTLPAINRYHSASPSLDDGRIDDARARLLDAAEWAYRAAEQPTFAPRSPARYSAKFVGISADILVLKITPNAPKSQIDRVQDGASGLIAAGRGKWPVHVDNHVKMTVELVALPLNPVQSAQWKLDTPEGRERYRVRNCQLYVVARNLLDSWAEEVSTRTGDDKRDADKKAAEMQSKLHKWAEAEGVIPPPPQK